MNKSLLPWGKPRFPNSLAQLAAIRRKTADTEARLTRAHSLIYQALEELRPLVSDDRNDTRPVSLAWGHLVDAEVLVAELKGKGR